MSFKKHIPRIVGTAIVLVVAISVVLLIQSAMDSKPVKKKKVQQITLLKPPPPPPPPPKIDRPPPPEVEEKVEVPEPEQLEELPEVADAPPAGDLGLDADASAGSDGFGLRARKGGRGLLNGAGDPNVIYASQLQRLIEGALAEDERTRTKGYSVIARVWIGFDGSVTRAELASSTGQDEIDDSLIDLINQIALADAPPPNMKQPIRMRISSRM